MFAWSIDNGLDVILKCSVVTFSKAWNLQKLEHSFDNATLTCKFQNKDPSNSDHQLNCVTHINNIVSADFRRLKFILRHSKCVFTLSLSSLFYLCSSNMQPLFGPHATTCILDIKKVQEYFLKALTYWLIWNTYSIF